MGQINNELEGSEFEDAVREMDFTQNSLVNVELTDIGTRLERMSPEELLEFFEGKKDKRS